MSCSYGGRNPKIRKFWNPKDKVVIAPVIKKRVKMSMSSPEYADWHKKNVVLRLLLRAMEDRERLANC